jgi:hypothetical protein
MFYKFDVLSNRLGRTTPINAINPAGLTSAVQGPIVEPEFSFESRKVKPVKLEVDVRYIHGTPGQAASASLSSKPLGTIPALDGYKNVAKYQKIWQASENLMVWQKRGLRDVGPYYFTLGACAVGVAYCVYLIGRMSFPKKAE